MGAANLPRRRVVVGLFFVGLAATVLTVLAGVRAGEVPACLTGSMIDLQLARTPQRAVELLRGCTSEDLGAIRRTLVVDSALFIPLYMLTLPYWCLVAHREAPPRTRAAGSAFIGGALAAWLAGGLDWLENLALVRVLNEHGNSTAGTALALAASVSKWLLVGFAVVMSLWAMARLGRAALRRPQTGPDPVFHSTRPDRWDRAADVPGVDDQPSFGISFSGGGIRSASFCMGALQVLQEAKLPGSGTSLFGRARWLTSVSGGGYLAGARQMLARGGVATPFSAGSPEEDHVRRHGRYLAESVGEWLSAGTRVLAGLVLNLGVIWLVLFVAARPVGWLHAELWDLEVITETSRPLNDGSLWALVALPAGAAVACVLLAVLARPQTDAALPFTVGGFLWWSAALFGVTAVAAAGIAVLVPLSDVVAAELLRVGRGTARAREAAAAGGAGLLTALVTFARVKAPSRATFERWLRRGQGGEAGDDKPGGPRPARFPMLGKLARVLAGFLLAALAAVLFAGLVQDAARVGIAGDTKLLGLTVVDWLVAALAAGALVALNFFGDQTSWSLHPLYKRRLSTAFALRPAPGGVATPPYSEPTSLSELAEPVSGQPELVVCAAANVSGPELAPPGRRAVTFTFGHEWVGGPELGYVPPTSLAAALTPSLRGDTTLLASMAISGAAFASAMGRHSKGGLNALVAAANLRLGVWLPSPRYAGEVARQQARRVRTRSLTYLGREVFGSYDPAAPLLYLTDGGHYENLGLVELLRRKCRVVACFDASGGPGTLTEAVRLAYEELGVTVSFPSGALDSVRTSAELRRRAEAAPDELDPLAARTAAAEVIVGTIEYRDGAIGSLVYARAVLTEQTPETIRYYAGEQPRFPNDPTGDQWFDGEQFNNYVVLGRHAATQATPHLVPALTALGQ